MRPRAHHVVPNAPSAARIKSNTYATMSPTNTIVIDVSPPLATVTHNAGMSPTLALALCPHARAFDSLARIRILIIFIVFPVSTLRRRVVVVVIALLYICTYIYTHPPFLYDRRLSPVMFHRVVPIVVHRSPFATS